MSRFATMLAQAPHTRSITGIVDHWIETLSEEDRKDFLQAANDPTIPTVTLTHVMRQLGYTGGNSTFSHWRNSQCRK